MIRKINELNCKSLWEGCLFAAIAHAIMVGEYPELSSEHSWDGMNYNMQNLAGCRGTISFFNDGFVAVFQSLEHIDFEHYSLDKTNEFLSGADEKIIKVANEEALQYVLETVDGKVMPVISSAFWADADDIYSNHSFDDIIENGGYLLEYQLLTIEEASIAWQEYYEMGEEQVKLTEVLFSKKLAAGDNVIHLTEDEKSILFNLYGDDVDECIESLSEIQIVV